MDLDHNEVDIRNSTQRNQNRLLEEQLELLNSQIRQYEDSTTRQKQEIWLLEQQKSMKNIIRKFKKTCC